MFPKDNVELLAADRKKIQALIVKRAEQYINDKHQLPLTLGLLLLMFLEVKDIKNEKSWSVIIEELSFEDMIEKKTEFMSWSDYQEHLASFFPKSLPAKDSETINNILDSKMLDSPQQLFQYLPFLLNRGALKVAFCLPNLSKYQLRMLDQFFPRVLRFSDLNMISVKYINNACVQLSKSDQGFVKRIAFEFFQFVQQQTLKDNDYVSVKQFQQYVDTHKNSVQLKKDLEDCNQLQEKFTLSAQHLHYLLLCLRASTQQLATYQPLLNQLTADIWRLIIKNLQTTTNVKNFYMANLLAPETMVTLQKPWISLKREFPEHYKKVAEERDTFTFFTNVESVRNKIQSARSGGYIYVRDKKVTVKGHDMDIHFEVDFKQLTPKLFKAVAKNNLEQIKMLIDEAVKQALQGCKVSIQPDQQQGIEEQLFKTILTYCHRQVGDIRDPHFMFYQNCLMLACEIGDKKLVEELIKLGADVNFYPETHMPALQWASRNGHLDCVALLLEHDAEVNATGRFNYTALHWAASSGHKDIVKCLLDHGADTSIKGGGNFTAAALAFERGHPELQEFIKNYRPVKQLTL